MARASLETLARPAWMLDGPQGEPPEPPVRTRLQQLPLKALRWDDFEKLCLRLARLDGEAEHWQLYGAPGQAQGGIDIFVRKPAGGKYVTWQSKRYQTMTPARLKAAVKTFLKGPWAAKSERFVLATSASLDNTEMATAIEEAAADLRAVGVVFDPRDEAKLSEELKSEPELVDDFFDRPWVAAFCGQATADALGRRLARGELVRLRTRLHDLYRAHFASVDPGVLRATGLGAPLQSPLPLTARFVPPDLYNLADAAGSEREARAEVAPPEPTEDGRDAGSPRPEARTRLNRPVERRRTPLATWSEDVGRAIVVGAPGAGKSTLLRFLALDSFAAEPRLAPLRERFPDHLPVWISFPFWTRRIKTGTLGAPVSLLGIVKSWFDAQGEPDLADLVLRAIDDGRALLLVDGVDEWADEASAASAITLLNTFVATRDLAVIVTSRTHGAKLLASLDRSWKRFEIAPLTLRQQTDFAAAWIEHMHASPEVGEANARARQRAEMFVREVQRVPQIVPLAEAPLLLGGLVAIALSGASLPRSRYRAYEELTVRLLESHPQARGQAALASETFDDLDAMTRKRVLAQLAFEVQVNPTTEAGLDAIGIRAAQDFCKGVLIAELDLASPDAADRARRLLSTGEERIGILVRKSPEELGFLHRAFQEFLAAQRIGELDLQAQCDLMRARGGDPRWREVLLFVMEAAARPTDVDALVEALELSVIATPSGETTAVRLLADATCGDVRRTVPTTKRLIRRLFDIVEHSPDWASREGVLRTLIAGLSNEQAAVLIRPKLREWFPDWNGYALKDALRLMADWDPDPQVDDILWRNLQNDVEGNRRQAAASLGKRCGGDPDWLQRLCGAIRDPATSESAGAALVALAHGWRQEPVVKELAASALESRDPELIIAGHAARIELGVQDNADRDRLIAIVTGEDWTLQGRAARLLADGWPDDPQMKAELLKVSTSRSFIEDHIAFTLATAFPGDNEVADRFATCIADGKGTTGRYEFWNLLAKNFQGHPQIVAAIDAGVGAWEDQTYDLARAAAVAPTPAIRDALLRTLEKPKHLIFWTVDALLDHWGMDDPDVATALRRAATLPLEIVSDFADRLPDILSDPAEAEDLLRRCLAQSGHDRQLRANSVVDGLRKLGVTEHDATLVDDILAMDLLGGRFRDGQVAASLFQAYPRDPRVVAHAIRQLRHDEGLIGTIALLMKDLHAVRAEVLSVSAPLPDRLRAVIAETLPDRGADDAFSRGLLWDGVTDSQQGVISGSIVGAAKAYGAAVMTPALGDMVATELRAIGRRMDGRRLGGLAAAVVLGRFDLLENPDVDLRMTTLSSGDENPAAVAAIAENWTALVRSLGLERSGSLFRSGLDSLITTFASYAEKLPDLRNSLLEMIDASGQPPESMAAFRLIAQARPRDAALRERCLTNVQGVARSWSTAETQLVSAEILGRNFGGDDELLRQLIVMNGDHALPGVIASLCEGWPQSDGLQKIFDDLVAGKRKQGELNMGASFKLMALKSAAPRLLDALSDFANRGDGGIWDAIPYWLPSVNRRVQEDDDLAQMMRTQLETEMSPSVALSLASILIGVRGLSPDMSDWGKSRIAASAREPVCIFAFDLTKGRVTMFRRRLMELVHT